MPGERGDKHDGKTAKPYAGGPGRLTHAERVIDPRAA